jgi:hypothetical protein
MSSSSAALVAFFFSSRTRSSSSLIRFSRLFSDSDLPAHGVRSVDNGTLPRSVTSLNRLPSLAAAPRWLTLLSMQPDRMASRASSGSGTKESAARSSVSRSFALNDVNEICRNPTKFGIRESSAKSHASSVRDCTPRGERSPHAPPLIPTPACTVGSLQTWHGCRPASGSDLGDACGDACVSLSISR